MASHPGAITCVGSQIANTFVTGNVRIAATNNKSDQNYKGNSCSIKCAAIEKRGGGPRLIADVVTTDSFDSRNAKRSAEEAGYAVRQAAGAKDRKYSDHPVGDEFVPLAVDVHGAFGAKWLDLLHRLARRAAASRHGQQGEQPGFNESPGPSPKSSGCAWPPLCSGPSLSRSTCAQAGLWRRPPASPGSGACPMASFVYTWARKTYPAGGTPTTTATKTFLNFTYSTLGQSLIPLPFLRDPTYLCNQNIERQADPAQILQFDDILLANSSINAAKNKSHIELCDERLKKLMTHGNKGTSTGMDALGGWLQSLSGIMRGNLIEVALSSSYKLLASLGLEPGKEFKVRSAQAR
eukprot:SM000099S25205  [mRNA]  locus=s99:170137:172620:- [translate_table: standard]